MQNPHDSKTIYEKRCKREKFRRRVAIEPIIGHLKKLMEQLIENAALAEKRGWLKIAF